MLFNLLRKVFEQLVLQTILLALVVGFHQLQAGYFHIQIHTLFDTGVSGAQSLDLGKTEGCFIHIIAGSTGDLEVMIWLMNFCLFSTVCQRYASKVPSVT